MRILLDATASVTSGGGLNTYLSNLLSAWAQVAPQDELITVVTRDCSADVLAAARAIGRLESIGDKSPFARAGAQQVAIPYLMRHYSPDVLLASTPVQPVATRVPVVAVVHDLRYISNPGEFNNLQGRYRRLLYDRTYRQSKHLIAISETTAKALIGVCPEAAPKTVVVYHGADHVDSWPKSAKANQAIAFGHWSNKRPDLAIRVWAGLRNKVHNFDWTLHVVGTHAETARYLQGLTQELGIGDLIRIHGFLAPHDFQALFTASRLVLFPTTEEGFGLPIVEAMRLGIPVVTSDIPATREVGGDCALYADVDSVDELIARCAEVVSSAQRREDLSNAGRAWSSRFSWQRTAEQTREVLEMSVVRPSEIARTA